MIERKDIEHLAALSRIRLSEEEKESFQKEIDSILSYVAQIQEVSEKAPAGIEVPQAINAFREDVPERNGGEYTKDLIDEAPFSDGNSVKVKNMF